MKLGVDVNRHKEIIVKAISAILLLLLKHFKLNHIYQVRFTDIYDKYKPLNRPPAFFSLTLTEMVSSVPTDRNVIVCPVV